MRVKVILLRLTLTQPMGKWSSLFPRSRCPAVVVMRYACIMFHVLTFWKWRPFTCGLYGGGESPDEDDGDCCRICHKEAHSTTNPALMTPCQCSGSLRFIPHDCLETWSRWKSTQVKQMRSEATVSHNDKAVLWLNIATQRAQEGLTLSISVTHRRWIEQFNVTLASLGTHLSVVTSREVCKGRLTMDLDRFGGLLPKAWPAPTGTFKCVIGICINPIFSSGTLSRRASFIYKIWQPN